MNTPYSLISEKINVHYAESLRKSILNLGFKLKDLRFNVNVQDIERRRLLFQSWDHLDQDTITEYLCESRTHISEAMAVAMAFKDGKLSVDDLITMSKYKASSPVDMHNLKFTTAIIILLQDRFPVPTVALEEYPSILQQGFSSSIKVIQEMEITAIPMDESSAKWARGFYFDTLPQKFRNRLMLGTAGGRYVRVLKYIYDRTLKFEHLPRFLELLTTLSCFDRLLMSVGFHFHPKLGEDHLETRYILTAAKTCVKYILETYPIIAEELYSVKMLVRDSLKTTKPGWVRMDMDFIENYLEKTRYMEFFSVGPKHPQRERQNIFRYWPKDYIGHIFEKLDNLKPEPDDKNDTNKDKKTEPDIKMKGPDKSVNDNNVLAKNITDSSKGIYSLEEKDKLSDKIISDQDFDIAVKESKISYEEFLKKQQADEVKKKLDLNPIFTTNQTISPIQNNELDDDTNLLKTEKFKSPLIIRSIHKVNKDHIGFKKSERKKIVQGIIKKEIENILIGVKNLNEITAMDIVESMRLFKMYKIKMLEFLVARSVSDDHAKSLYEALMDDDKGDQSSETSLMR